MAKHRYSARNKHNNGKLYQKMNEIGVEYFHIVLLQDYPECQNKEHLYQKERKYIARSKPSLNLFIPNRTSKERIEEHHEHKKELDRQFYQKKVKNELNLKKNML